MPLLESTIPGLLAERARLQPDEVAYTFIDYDVDPAGFAESLTWSQVYQRAQVVAEELLRHGRKGDRAAILAPQGLEYIVAFYGAMTAGFIAVPLPVPALGQLDERVNGALRDCQPVAVLTTSAVVSDIMTYVGGFTGGATPAVVEVDALDFHSPRTTEMNIDDLPEMAYLQYTSGSTRAPAGVIMTHRNVIANVKQVFDDYMEHRDGIPPKDITMVSWLPFYHDMGLIQGVFASLLTPSEDGGLHGRPAMLMSPVAFLQKPARWIQQLAIHPHAWSAAPNFAFELSVRRTSDADLEGMDLGGVLGIISGSERIHSATIRRFNERFAKFNMPTTTVRPSYGLAEATLYVISAPMGHTPSTVRFDYEKLAAGHAERCGAEGGSELVTYGAPRSSTVRIVDPETRTENPDGKVGEIWVHGEQVAMGYWRNPQQTERTFGGEMVDPSEGTPVGPWLRTGDLGVMSEGEMFIIGRIKDLLIVDGRNHYPDDIEATIQEITGGRVAAISVLDETSEQLVAIAELKKKGASEAEALDKLRAVKREVASAIKRTHSVRVADLVFVAPGSIPITTSGKIRRSACVDRYRQDEFSRLDVTA
ncbi:MULTISPECIES: AMP-binding protein [Mycobacteriaceae]|uniref:AMP-binding protein n=1 Tax=Mycolicibacterium parafortuitum TaxID=39692 RepID=A0ACC6MFS6_MYCPF|nr:MULTISPECIES: AMP-binding protein [Mycobacteriaceae]MDZ5085818.1 AMP-binding protein [Mycolicibacterium parafortuitum]GFM20649.1 acyl-CoA synthetase [Mycobacterium sp. PO1]GFM24505.1 acyl-CoA synthetase [Mycobacterium sp. PO2]